MIATLNIVTIVPYGFYQIVLASCKL